MKNKFNFHSMIKRIIMKWRYNQLQDIAGTVFSMNYKYELVNIELQKASSVILDSAEIMRKYSEDPKNFLERG